MTNSGSSAPSTAMSAAQVRALRALAQRPEQWFRPCRDYRTLEALRARGYCEIRVMPMTEVARITTSGLAEAEDVEMVDTPEKRIAFAEAEIRTHEFTIRYVDYCEDSRTPGLLGQIAGVTDWERREVKIGLVANPTVESLASTLEHEARHVRDPDWDCGNRDVFGRGGRKGQREGKP